MLQACIVIYAYCAHFLLMRILSILPDLYRIAHCIPNAQMRLVWFSLPRFVNCQPHVTVPHRGGKGIVDYLLGSPVATIP